MKREDQMPLYWSALEKAQKNVNVFSRDEVEIIATALAYAQGRLYPSHEEYQRYQKILEAFLATSYDDDQDKWRRLKTEVDEFQKRFLRG